LSLEEPKRPSNAICSRLCFAVCQQKIGRNLVRAVLFPPEYWKGVDVNDCVSKLVQQHERECPAQNSDGPFFISAQLTVAQQVLYEVWDKLQTQDDRLMVGKVKRIWLVALLGRQQKRSRQSNPTFDVLRHGLQVLVLFQVEEQLTECRSGRLNVLNLDHWCRRRFDRRRAPGEQQADCDEQKSVHLCRLKFELTGRQRQDAKPGLVRKYHVPTGRLGGLLLVLRLSEGLGRSE
jgi:hypothetical protein